MPPGIGCDLVQHKGNSVGNCLLRKGADLVAGVGVSGNGRRIRSDRLVKVLNAFVVALINLGPRLSDDHLRRVAIFRPGPAGKRLLSSREIGAIPESRD